MNDKNAFRPLADLYRSGRGTPRDLRQARHFYELAAWKGDLVAMRRLGHLFSHNEGIQRGEEKNPEFWDGIELDYDRAHEWYLMAAEKGDRTAQCRLGYFNLKGIGKSRNYLYAFYWYSKSAEQSVLPAISQLIYLYSHGVGFGLEPEESGFWTGVPFDLNKAVYWCERAAHMGHMGAVCMLAAFYSHGLGLPEEPDFVILSNQEGKVGLLDDMCTETSDLRGDFIRAAQGSRKSKEVPYYLKKEKQFILFRKDYRAAFELYSKAAEQGYHPAQRRLAYMYYVGKGVAQDYKLAFEWCLKAAEQGNDLAQCQVGCLYENGFGVVQDYRNAFEWYLKSALQGNKLAAPYAIRLVNEKKIVPTSDELVKITEIEDVPNESNSNSQGLKPLDQKVK